jgi:hypothetical protein
MPKNTDLEELIFEFANIMYKLGRLETDGKNTTKEYNQYCKKREELTKVIGEFLKSL